MPVCLRQVCGDIEGSAYVLPTLASGGFYEIAITADVDALGGTVTNTATASVPSGWSDPNTGNNPAPTRTCQSDRRPGDCQVQRAQPASRLANHDLYPHRHQQWSVSSQWRDCDRYHHQQPPLRSDSILSASTVNGTPRTGRSTVADLTGTGIALANLDATQQAP